MARYIPPKPPPGPQRPDLYAPYQVGPLYQELGEQPGYIYNPATDKYTVNPQAQQEMLERQGLGPEKPPSIYEQLMPAAVIAGGGAAAYGIGTNVADYLGTVKVPSIAELGSSLGIGGTQAGTQIASNVPTTLGAGTGAVSALPGLGSAASSQEILSSIYSGGPANYVETIPSYGIEATAPMTAAPGLLSLQGIAGGAGVIAGGYGMYNAYESGDELGGAISGAGAGLGAGMLGSAMGAPILASLGLGPLAPLAIGGALLGLGLGALGGPTAVEKAKAKEQKRMKKVLEAGTAGYDQFVSALQQNETANMRGQVDERVAPDFIGFTESGERLNNKFAASRDVKDLQGVDIWGNVSFWEQFGNRWIGELTPAERALVAQKALDLGLVKEGAGVIKVDKSEELNKYLEDLRKTHGGPIQDDWMKIDYSKYGVGQSTIQGAEEEQKAAEPAMSKTPAPSGQPKAQGMNLKMATGPINKPLEAKKPMASKYTDLMNRIVPIGPTNDTWYAAPGDSTLRPIRGSRPAIIATPSIDPGFSPSTRTPEQIEAMNSNKDPFANLPPAIITTTPALSSEDLLNQLSGIRPITLPAGAKILQNDLKKIPQVELKPAQTVAASSEPVAIVQEAKPVAVRPTFAINPGPSHDTWYASPGDASLRPIRGVRQPVAVVTPAAPTNTKLAGGLLGVRF